jgi:hypothetical protein
MGYYIMPQADEPDVNAVAQEAAKVFIKAHGVPTEGLGIAMDIERRVLRVTDKASGTSEVFTFAELGFL